MTRQTPGETIAQATLDGSTALHEAAESGNAAAVQLLITRSGGIALLLTYALNLNPPLPPLQPPPHPPPFLSHGSGAAIDERNDITRATALHLATQASS